MIPERDEAMVIFPKGKTRYAAESLANLIENVVSIASFQDKNNNIFYGVIVEEYTHLQACIGNKPLYGKIVKNLKEGE